MNRAALRPKPARVRPYSVGDRRPRRRGVLLVETFVAAADSFADPPGAPPGGGRPAPAGLAAKAAPEARAVVDLCRRLRPVAEIAALLKMPLGVVRVLLLELADQGSIRVFDTGHGTGRPDRALLERVRGGLHRL